MLSTKLPRERPHVYAAVRRSKKYVSLYMVWPT